MAESIDLFEEDKVRRAKRTAAWEMCQQASVCDTTIRKQELAPKAISALDRTETAVKSALAEMQLASPTDQIRDKTRVSSTKPQGSNRVTGAVESTGILKPKIQSLFDLSGSMGRKEKLSRVQKTEASLPKEPSLPETNRPELPPPKLLNPESALTNYLRIVLDVHGSMEKVISECTTHFDQTTRQNLKDLEKLREAKTKAVEEYAKELSTKESWATLQTMARYLAYASSLAIGSMLLYTGAAGPAGYLLIAAGGLGLGASIAKDAGLLTAVAAHFDKSQETQKQIVQSIELATTLLAIGLGLMGTTMASPTQAPAAFAWMSAALSATSRLGEGLSEKRFSEIMAQLEQLETNIRMKQEYSKSISNFMQDDLTKVKQFTDEVQKILSNSEVHI